MHYFHNSLFDSFTILTCQQAEYRADDDAQQAAQHVVQLVGYSVHVLVDETEK